MSPWSCCRDRIASLPCNKRSSIRTHCLTVNPKSECVARVKLAWMYRHMNYNVFLFAWRPLLSAHSSLHQPYLAFRPGKALAFLGSHVSRYWSACFESSSKFLKRFSRSWNRISRSNLYHHFPTGTPSLSPSSSWSHRASVHSWISVYQVQQA